MSNKPIQHGEIMLVPVEALPAGKTAKHNNFIVGHSETSHHHVLESAAKFEVITEADKQDIYLRLFEPAKLVHQKTFDKHRTLTVQPGIYRVLHKTEYSPWESVIRTVKD